MASFLHLADVHLGLRVTRFDDRICQRIREARMESLENAVGIARQEQVDFVLVAGDLFDDGAVDSTTARRAHRILAGAELPIYVIPGNHDPLLPGSVWDRPPWDADSDRITVLRERAAYEIEAGVMLHACPLFRKTSLTDPTAWIEGEKGAAELIHVGLAHGSVNDRATLAPDDHLIAVDAASRLGLDYLALGHWHGANRFGQDGGERMAYPGVPEPMGFPGTRQDIGWHSYSDADDGVLFAGVGRGTGLLVRIDQPGAAPVLEEVQTGVLAWESMVKEIRDKQDLQDVVSWAESKSGTDLTMLRLVLSGLQTAEMLEQVAELEQILSGRYLFHDLDTEALFLEPTNEEIQVLAGQGVLRRVYEELVAKIAEGDAQGADLKVLRRAMVLLYRVAREVAS